MNDGVHNIPKAGDWLVEDSKRWLQFTQKNVDENEAERKAAAKELVQREKDAKVNNAGLKLIKTFGKAVEATSAKLKNAVAVKKSGKYYIDENGKKVVSSFAVNESGKTIYLDEKGKALKKTVIAVVDAKTGKETLYYVGKTGKLAKKTRVTIEGVKYQVNKKGVLTVNET